MTTSAASRSTGVHLKVMEGSTDIGVARRMSLDTPPCPRLPDHARQSRSRQPTPLAGVVAIAACTDAVSAEMPLLAESGVELPQPQVEKVRLMIAGSQVDVTTHLYIPPRPGPHPVVVFAHGHGGPPHGRPQDLKAPVFPQHARFWMELGFAVVAPIRPGYGNGGGTYGEGGMEDLRRCCTTTKRWNPGVSVRQAGDTMEAVTLWARSQPWVDPNRIILAGHSLGGLASLDVAARAPAGVVGVVNFAGGAGRRATVPGHMKKWAPELLADKCRSLGRDVQVPSLWVYTQNDLIADPKTSRKIFAAFQGDGSGHATLHLVPSVGSPQDNGHGPLMTAGQPMWHEEVASFAARIAPGRPPPSTKDARAGCG